MKSELIERFRYRFELWRREQREDLYGSPEGPIVEIHDKKESVAQMLFRYAGAYFTIFIILSGLSRLVGRYLPATRFAITIVVICIASFLGLGFLIAFLREWKAKRKAGADASTSSNQSLEPTAGRRDAHI